MSSMTATSAAARPSTTTTSCGNKLYEIPVNDAACAMPFGGNYTDVMSSCCKDADVVSYLNDCGLYCLAKGQSVEDLTDCLYDEGAKWQDVWCNMNKTSTATATGQADIPATASASVVASGGKSKGSGDDDGDDSGDDDDKSGASESDSAAPGVVPQAGASLLGLAIGALLFSATAFGAVQI